MGECMVTRRGGGADIGLNKICNLTVGPITTSNTLQYSHLSSGGVLATLENNKLYAFSALGTAWIDYGDFPVRVIGFFAKELNHANDLYNIPPQAVQLSKEVGGRWMTRSAQVNSYCICCENIANDDITLSAYDYNSVLKNYRILSAAIYEVSGID